MKLLRILLLTLILLPLLSFAQSVPVLSLQNCIDSAVKNSYLLQANESDIKAASGQALFEKSKAIPKVSGELASESRFLKPYDFSQVWASVHADWSLGDYLLKTDRAARQQVETIRLLKQQNRLDVIGKVSSLYMALLLNQKQKEILNTRLNFMQKHYDLAVSLWKAGLRTQMDVLQSKAEIIKIQQDTVRLAMTRDNLVQELARMLGQDRPGSLHLQTLNTEEIVKIQPSIADADLNNNPLLLSYASKIKTQKMTKQAIKAQQYPHLNLGGGYFNDADPTGDGNYWRINAGINVPIYYGHEIRKLASVSDAQTAAIASRQRQAKRKILIHLGQIESKLVQLRKLMQLQQLQLNTAQNTVDFSEVNYKAGLITNLEFITAQQQLTTSKLAVEASRLDYLMNLIEFYVSTNRVDKIKALASMKSIP